MSKLIFSTLSILVLLLSGVNCSTGRGGKGSQIDELKEAAEISRVITCTEGLVLNPGDGCSGSDYGLRNSAGHLIPNGSYIDSNGYVHEPEETTITNNGTPHTFPGYFISGALYLTKDDKAWTIRSLP